jgi:hypothetical protein
VKVVGGVFVRFSCAASPKPIILADPTKIADDLKLVTVMIVFSEKNSLDGVLIGDSFANHTAAFLDVLARCQFIHSLIQQQADIYLGL